jgi:4-hydroxyacetophenone monooxygenase
LARSNAWAQLVTDANIPALLMTLYQLTGNDRWLEPPFRPTRTRGTEDNDTGGLSPKVQDEIRNAAAVALASWAEGTPVRNPDPDAATLSKMMDVCMGEAVPDQYAKMALDELARSQRLQQDLQAQGVTRTPDGDRFPVVVIGSGVSGLTAALHLHAAGIESVILERRADLGGCWLDNRYPGCGVDTPSHLYSYSFFRGDWSTYFGKRDEVWSYLSDMADEFGLRELIRFEHDVHSMQYDERDHTWTLSGTSPDGSFEIQASWVVSATGQLSTPRLPAIDGMNTFAGDVFHSAEWPVGLSLDGKRVAVVGSGASAMQIVPAIADRCEELTIYQRSPHWIAPNERYFGQVSNTKRELIMRVPIYDFWYRTRLAWIFNDRVHLSLQIDPDWEYPDRSINEVNDGHRKFFESYLRDRLGDRVDLVKKSLPTYPPFGKRMLLDNGWYDTLLKPNVELVDGAVESLTAAGVVSQGDCRPADVVVMATGFRAQEPLHGIEVRGRDRQQLADAWRGNDPHAYLGITTNGFPNLFFLYGPNSNLGHGGSWIYMAECQVNYLTDLLSLARAQDLAEIEVRADVEREYNRRVDEAHARMIWSHPGMTTWYRNSEGRVVTNSPWRIVDYWRMTGHADLADYQTRSPAAQLPQSG